MVCSNFLDRWLKIQGSISSLERLLRAQKTLARAMIALAPTACKSRGTEYIGLRCRCHSGCCPGSRSAAQRRCRPEEERGKLRCLWLTGTLAEYGSWAVTVASSFWQPGKCSPRRRAAWYRHVFLCRSPSGPVYAWVDVVIVHRGSSRMERRASCIQSRTSEVKARSVPARRFHCEALGAAGRVVRPPCRDQGGAPFRWISQ